MKGKYDIYKWGIWWLLSLSFVIVFFHRLAPGVVAGDITSEFNMTAREWGSLTSVTLYSYALMQVPAGILLDYYGPRMICAAGMLTAGAGSIIFGFSTDFYGAFAGRLLVGVGTSVICVAILKIQSQWFTPEEFSAASSKMSFIANIGASLAIFPLAVLVSDIGWRNVFYAMGFASILFSILIYLFVRNKPSDYGLEVHGKDFPGGVSSAVKDTEIEKNIDVILALRSTIKNRYTWLNFLVLFSFVGCTTTLAGVWGISYLVGVYGITRDQGAFYISFIPYGFIAGSVIVGKAVLIFKEKYMDVTKIASIAILIIWVYIIIVKGGKPPLNFMPLLFFMMGTLASAHLLAFTNVKESNDIRYAGTAMSIVNAGEFAGSSIMSLFIGHVLDIKWTGTMNNGVRVYGPIEYKYAFSIFILVSLAGIVSSWLNKRKPG